MPRFEVVGIGLETGRKRVRIYEAKDEETAILMASSDGTVVETKKIRRLPDVPATEAQLAYAKDLGIKIPKQPTKNELSRLIDIAVEEDWPTKKQKQKAAKLGIRIPKDITADDLDDLISEREDQLEEDREEAKFRASVRSLPKKTQSNFNVIWIIIVAIGLIWIVHSCLKSIAGPPNVQINPGLSRESILRERLTYLRDIPEVAWYEINNNNVYIGFTSLPDDWQMIINAAALNGNRAINFGCHVWAVNANRKGWRPGSGPFYGGATARYGQVQP